MTTNQKANNTTTNDIEEMLKEIGYNDSPLRREVVNTFKKWLQQNNDELEKLDIQKWYDENDENISLWLIEKHGYAKPQTFADVVQFFLDREILVRLGYSEKEQKQKGEKE